MADRVLEGKVALITGAGRGIGKDIAVAFARQGANLVLVSRTGSELEASAGELRQSGREVLTLCADVSRWPDVESMAAAAIAKFRRIDILVNNAGVQGPIGPLWENDPDAWAATLLINVGGMFHCCRAVIPAMIRNGGGKIVNLSGGGASGARPYFTAYAASKTAVVRFTETLAEEVKQYNIQVNAVAPGAVNTKMTRQVLEAGASAGEKDLKDARKVAEQGNSAQSAAELITFLASEESDGISGRLISAQWDDWRLFPKLAAQFESSDLYKLRRVTEQR